MASKLTRSVDPLVWIDCEMTGLNPETDTILSISCYITTHDLVLLEPHGYHAVIATPVAKLRTMSQWCIDTHTRTGLIEQCTTPTVAVSATTAAVDLLAYIQRYVREPRTALLAGNTVHADKMFLVQHPWTPVVDWLHYRILDVSAIKEGVRRWCAEDILQNVPSKKGLHSAKEDILESIDEARYYMGLFRRLG